MVSNSKQSVIVPRSKQVLRRPVRRAPASSFEKAQSSLADENVSKKNINQRIPISQPERGTSSNDLQSPATSESQRKQALRMSRRTSQPTSSPASTLSTKDQLREEQQRALSSWTGVTTPPPQSESSLDQKRAVRNSEQQRKTQAARVKAGLGQSAIGGVVATMEDIKPHVSYLLPIGISVFKDVMDLGNADMIINSITKNSDLGFFTKLALNAFDGFAFSALMFVITLVLAVPLVMMMSSRAQRAGVKKRDGLTTGLTLGYFAEMSLLVVNIVPGMVLTTLWGIYYIRKNRTSKNKNKSKKGSKIKRLATFAGKSITGKSPVGRVAGIALRSK